MKYLFIIFLAAITCSSFSQFAPAAGEPGSSAVHKDSMVIVNWANSVESFNPGSTNIVNIAGPIASFGEPENALHYAEGTSVDIVSLGDLGSISLGFEYPIMNGVGNDFAVFENSFSDTYLEFAHVEVSTDGEYFVRFPSISNISTTVQTGTYAVSDPTLVNNLAGKYRQGYGTPFDLNELIGHEGINLDSINFVRIIDVVGTIDEAYGTLDSEGNLINDPYPSDFESGGFDLDAVAVLNENNPYANTTESELFTNMDVYPNPTNGLVHFSSVDPIKTVCIYTLTGKKVGEIDASNQIDLNSFGLASGTYILSIFTINDAVVNKKIYLN
jgi:hypothetical protein